MAARPTGSFYPTTSGSTSSSRASSGTTPLYGNYGDWQGKAGNIWKGMSGLGMPGRTLESLAFGDDLIAQGIINALGIKGYAQDIGGKEGPQLHGTDSDDLYDWWQSTFLPAYRGSPSEWYGTGTGGSGVDPNSKLWDPAGEAEGWAGLETAFGNLPLSMPSFDEMNFDDTQMNNIWERLQDIQAFDPNMPNLEGLGTNVTNIYEQLYGGPGRDRGGIQGFEMTDALRQLFPTGQLHTGAATVTDLLGEITDWKAPRSIGGARDDAQSILDTLGKVQGTFEDGDGITQLIQNEILRAGKLKSDLKAVEVPDLTAPYNQIVEMSKLLPGVTDELGQITGMSGADRDLMGVISKLVSGETPTAGELQMIVTALTPELDPYKVTPDDLTMPTGAMMLKAIGDRLPGADQIMSQLKLPEIGVSDLALPEIGVSDLALPGAKALEDSIVGRLPDAATLLDKMPFGDMKPDDLLQRLPFGGMTSDDLIDLLPGVDPMSYRDEVLSLLPDISAGDLSLPDAGKILERLTMPDPMMMLDKMPFGEISGTDLLDRMPGVSPTEFQDKILSLMPKIEAGDLSLPEADDLLTALPFDEVSKNDLLDQFVQSPIEFQQALLDFLPKVTAADLDLPKVTAADLGLPEVTATDMKRLGVLPSLEAADLGLPDVTLRTLGIDPATMGDPITSAITSALAGGFGPESPFEQALKGAKDRITGLTPTIDAVTPDQLLAALKDPLGEIGPDRLLGEIPFDEISGDALLGEMPFDRIGGDQMLDAITNLFPESLTPQVEGLLPGKDDILGAITSRMGQDLLPGDVGIDFSGADQTDLLSNLGLDFSGIRDLTELGMPADIWEGFADVGPLAEFLGGMDQNFWGDLQDVLGGRITMDDFTTGIKDLERRLGIKLDAAAKPVASEDGDTGDGKKDDGDTEMASDWNSWLKTLQDQITASYGKDPSEFGTEEGETYSDWLRADPVTASLMADFESETKQSRLQLREDLSRMGLLQTSTDTADAFADFETGVDRGQLDVLSDAAKRMQDLRTGAMDRGTTLADTMSRHDISVGDLTGWFEGDRTIGGQELDLDKLAVAIASLNPDLKLDQSPEGVQRAIFEIMLDSLGGSMDSEYLDQLRNILKEERPEGAGGGNWLWNAITGVATKQGANDD